MRAIVSQHRELGFTFDHGPSVTCPDCETKIEYALDGFRCFHCGIIFCEGCAFRHFGAPPRALPTREAVGCDACQWRGFRDDLAREASDRCPQCGGFDLVDLNDPARGRRGVPEPQERPNVLVQLIWEAHQAFLNADPQPQPDLPFWVNLAQQQVEEARAHLEAGERTKAHNEFADLVVVAFRALHVDGVEPERFIAHRVRRHIVPKAAEIARRDRAGNGFKEARSA